VSIAATLADVAEDVGYAHINALSRVYEGRDFAYSTPDELTRFRLLLEPTVVSMQDHTASE
jgi:hypothetical protein